MARALTLATSLALAGLVVVITAFVTMRPGAGSRPAPAIAPPARGGSPDTGQGPAGPAAAVDSRQRPLSVDEAMRELDLIKPSRPRGLEDFTLPMPDGRQFRLSDHRSKVVFINFWATWCPPCREEMPSMERLYARLKDRPFAMVAVSLDASPSVVASYLADGHFTFPVVLDPKMDLANSYGVRALPASFIVDPRGVLVAMALGPRTWDGPPAQALMEGLAR